MFFKPIELDLIVNSIKINFNTLKLIDKNLVNTNQNESVFVATEFQEIFPNINKMYWVNIRKKEDIEINCANKKDVTGILEIIRKSTIGN